MTAYILNKKAPFGAFFVFEYSCEPTSNVLSHVAWESNRRNGVSSRRVSRVQEYLLDLKRSEEIWLVTRDRFPIFMNRRELLTKPGAKPFARLEVPFEKR